MKEGRPRLTRRTLLEKIAVASGAAPVLLAGVRSAHAGKATKEAVAYQDTPNNGQSCADCQSFIEPSECDTVEGTVSPQGWCRIYIKQS